MSQSNVLSEVSGWHGVWTALVTPLTTARGSLELDVKSLESLVERQIAGGVRGLVIAGSTGEGSLLSPENYRALLVESRRIAGKRIPLVAGLGIGGTESCLKSLALAKELGFEGGLASPPAYVKAPQRYLVEHYLRLGEEGLPICVYEVASRAASSIDVETIARIVESKRPGARWIVSTKDASAKMERALETSRRLGDRVALLSGDDFTVAPFVACGGVGVISVVSHLTPRALGRVLSHAREGKREVAYREQNRLIPLIDSLFWESNPIPVKSAVKEMGWIASAEFSAPLGPMDPAKLAAMMEVVRGTTDA